MQRYGKDSLNSWLISSACCFINMMLYGMARISGILFVASISRFNVSRQKASFPYTFDNFMRNTSGPLVGFLGHRYGVRAVTTVGCLLGAIGAGTCYFAENIETVTVLWGAIFGLGFGLGSILLPVSINQHFDKHRATASGISFSGACLGSFVLPPIVEILLNTYGLSGTYLFLSGFILNCVPAALLLKKPSFDIKTNPYDSDESETQSIVSKVKLYTVEDGCQNHKPASNVNSEINTLDKGGCNRNLTYNEKMKKLSTQTLLSDCSIRTNVSEPSDAEEITENSKGRQKNDPKVDEAENLSMSSGSTDQNAYSEIDAICDKDSRVSSSFQFDRPAVPVNRARSLSTGQIFSNNHAYLNYGYNTGKEDISRNCETVSKSMTKTRNISNNISLGPQNGSESFANYSSDKNSQGFKFFSENLKIPPIEGKQFSKSADWSNDCHHKTTNKIGACPPDKTFCLTEKKSSLGSFSIIFDPMFILIAITNAIYCFTFVCMITVVVDFARDLHIAPSEEKYVIMFLSVGDIVGRLSLGWITDRGYMTTTGFAALCYACQGIIIAAVAWSNGFLTLIICVTLYGLSESGIIVIYPIIIAQYIDQDKQTVAIPSSNFLSGPLCLTVAPLIGYFRDQIGAYDYIFYGLSILSGVCCLSLLLAPCIARYRSRSRVRQND